MNNPSDDRRRISRREMLQSAGLAAGVAVGAPLATLLAQAPAPATAPPVIAPQAPPDASKVPGFPSAALGERSPFEQPALAPLNVTSGATSTPLQTLRGTITPADLHFQRHHNGIAIIDPARYSLVVHGMVNKPLRFTLDDLKRFPAETHTYFVECAGNGRAAYRAAKPEMSPQDVDGMTSNSEWTGVRVATLLREAGVKGTGSWVLAEGGDAALLSRSIPMEKMLGDALIVYAQNGEPLRAANGYPARLLLPGYEGNMCIKWLRRLEVIDQPNMSRDETVKYTDPLPDGTSRQFSFVMDAKSLITSPAFPQKLTSHGWWPVTGIAWTGRGRITAVDVSVDGGRTWHAATIVGTAQPNAHTRFEYMWNWDGKAAQVMSRAHDETGYVQPALEEFKRVRGKGTDYHFNAIRTWNVAADGSITFGA
ncbi:MAG: sulfite dehydrogenase [Gemmatimonadaceae bacterium]